MAKLKIVILFGTVLVFGSSSVWGQAAERVPHIGYIYPAGGQQGQTFIVTIGGQYLGGAQEVYVTGAGVTARIMEHGRSMKGVQPEQRVLVRETLKELTDTRLEEMGVNAQIARNRAGQGAELKPEKKTPASESDNPKNNQVRKNKSADNGVVKMPKHYLLYDLENKNLRELAHISSLLYYDRDKMQDNRQLAESLTVEVTIDKNAEPGFRELRASGRMGLTNPLAFQIGSLPEVYELEPNGDEKFPGRWRMEKFLRPDVVTLPVVLNGQIMPGDVDKWRFEAVRGQKLVIETEARSLIPYLADAVPGWFQATLALYDDKGNEVAYADDYQFNPDPVLLYRIPQDGEYTLEIRDSIYRGREDFVYRVAVGELPFITQIFPLGTTAGSESKAQIRGWNLARKELTLESKADDCGIKQTMFSRRERLSNLVTYAVDDLPECMEAEGNDNIEGAQAVTLPMIVNGRIEKANDVDIFRLEGKAGTEVVIEVFGRRLNSPIDSLLKLTNQAGEVLDWNDDHMVKEGHLHLDIVGLMTHHADSYLRVKLPEDGSYYVHLAETQQHGGQAYAYRLHISQAQGDYELRVTPPSLTAQTGGLVPVCVHALRKNDFEGEIAINLKDAPAGFELAGGLIPAGRDEVKMTIKVPNGTKEALVNLRFEGEAMIAGKTLRRAAVPAENMMQAFLWRHLVPVREQVLEVQKVRWKSPDMKLASTERINIPAGGSTQVVIRTPRRPLLDELELELNDAPAGFSLADVRTVRNGLAFKIQVEEGTSLDGYQDNLIVETFRSIERQTNKGKQIQRVSMGVLPAIPVEVVGVGRHETSGMRQER